MTPKKNRDLIIEGQNSVKIDTNNKFCPKFHSRLTSKILDLISKKLTTIPAGGLGGGGKGGLCSIGGRQCFGEEAMASVSGEEWPGSRVPASEKQRRAERREPGDRGRRESDDAGDRPRRETDDGGGKAAGTGSERETGAGEWGRVRERQTEKHTGGSWVKDNEDSQASPFF